MGETHDITRNLFDHINRSIVEFKERYQDRLSFPIDIAPHNAIDSLESVLGVVHRSGYQIYLLIDEYDNFANEVLMQSSPDEPRYKSLLYGEGILKTLFKTVKSGATRQGIGRVFITGVSPLVMSDMTSGYNASPYTHLFI